MYDVDYFIKKFSEIPEELWCAGSFTKVNGNKVLHCVLGWCGAAAHHTVESAALYDLFSEHGIRVAKVNDGADHRYRQPTPKQRIIAALVDIKAGKYVPTPV